MSQYFEPNAPLTDEAARQGERLWDFLQRSSWERSRLAREQLSHFLARVPEYHRAGFLTRLRSGDEREVYAANSELFVHAVMIGLGLTCELDPATPGGSRTDLRIETGTHLEIHRSSLSNADAALKQRRRDVVRGLEEVLSPDFWLVVRMSVPAATPSVRRIRRAIENWLQSLSWDEEHAQLQASPGRYQPPERRWPTADGHIVLSALPKERGQRGTTSAVGVISGGPLLIEGFETLEGNIQRKRRQHRSLAEPLVVVLDLSEGLSYRDEVAAALYGPIVDFVDARPRYQERDRTKGIWAADTGPRQPAAVLTVDHLGLADAATAAMTLWLAPGAANPLGAGPWDIGSLHESGETVSFEAAERTVASTLL